MEHLRAMHVEGVKVGKPRACGDGRAAMGVRQARGKPAAMGVRQARGDGRAVGACHRVQRRACSDGRAATGVRWACDGHGTQPILGMATVLIHACTHGNGYCTSMPMPEGGV